MSQRLNDFKHSCFSREKVGDRGIEKILFYSKVVNQGSQSDFGRSGDVAERRTGIAVHRKQHSGRVQNPFLQIFRIVPLNLTKKKMDALNQYLILVKMTKK